MGEKVKFTWPTYKKQLCDGIIKLLKEDVLTDFKVIGGEDQEKNLGVKVHHLIVSIFCPVLKNLAEKEMELSECTTDDIKTIMEFLYTGTASIKKDRLLNVKSGAKAIGLECLVQSVDNYFKMKSKLTVLRNSKFSEENRKQFKPNSNEPVGDEESVQPKVRELKFQANAKKVPNKTVNASKGLLKRLRDRQTSRIAVKSKDFACSHCSFRTTCRQQLIPHLAIKHHVDINGKEIEKKHKCKHCPNVYWTSNQLTQHRIAKHSTVTYNCDKCSYVCFTRQRIRMHKEVVHSDEKPYMCEKCGKTFKAIRTCNKHKAVHEDAVKTDCEICGKAINPRGLKRHMKLHLSDEKPHQCHLCGYATRHRYNLRTHLRGVHKVKLDTMGTTQTCDSSDAHNSDHYENVLAAVYIPEEND